MSAARLRLVECRAVLGGERDKFRLVWDDQATPKDRRLLLAMAGEVQSAASIYAGRAWGDLSPDLRAKIKTGLQRWSAWAEKLK